MERLTYRRTHLNQYAPDPGMSRQAGGMSRQARRMSRQARGISRQARRSGMSRQAGGMSRQGVLLIEAPWYFFTLFHIGHP